jgi:hypothetical protein
MLPTVVLADEEGSVTGTFTLGGTAPTVSDVYVTDLSDVTVSTMTPGSSYKVKIDIGDANGMEDIDQVRVALVYDATDTDPSADPGETGNTQNLVCLKWLKSGDAWSISPNSSTTWSLTTLNCVKPSNMTATTGTWVFYVTVGKVANEAAGGATNPGWDLFGEAYDDTNTIEAWGDRDLAVEWYGAITVTGSPAAFGSVVLAESEKMSSAVSTNYISNGNYLGQVKSLTDTWTTGTYNVTLVASAPGAGQFSLLADDDANTGDAVNVNTSYQTIDGGSITGESGDDDTDNHLWLTLGGTSILAGGYSGSIYYQIANG